MKKKEDKSMEEKKILVFGTGKSGIAATELLQEKGAFVVLYDGNGSLDKEEILEKLNTKKQVQVFLGELPQEVIEELSLAVLSPGIPLESPEAERLKAAGVKIWGEIELASYFSRGKTLAVTGTNGKTTTTALTGEIMKAACDDVQVVGNIGIPYTSVALQTKEDTVTVAEISSFQLETIERFAPKVSAILNITPDHLNRHHTMENYTNIKLAVTKNQTKDDVCILNYEDERLREKAADISAKVVFFSSKRELKEGIFLSGEEIWLKIGSKKELICNINELQLIGRHNYENVMAAAAMTYCYGVPLEVIKKVIKSFRAVEHRIEYVTMKRGVRFYNDSKGTNPDAAIQAIRAMKWPTCLIGGGYDKQSEYTEWIRSFDGKVKKLVLIGQTKEKIAAEASACGFTDYVFADSLEEAVLICYDAAKAGDAVLLSPACASWGMFPNYEKRGELFKEIVYGLKE